VVPIGGNVSLTGDIHLNVGGTLRLAAGGILTADGEVTIKAAYAAIGQGFRAPDNPGDEYIPFRKSPATPESTHSFAPTFGTGNLAINAGYIDIGTLSLQNIGTSSFDAGRGDIRGNGTLHMAGELSLNAATIYPTSGSNFSLFAYDHDGVAGSITFSGKSTGVVPLSAGGTLEAYASNISQLGVLRAPGGRIILGWDGTDLDPSDADLDSPFDIIARSTAPAPVTSSVILGEDSMTSVSLVSADGSNVWIPYGLSPDGKSWIDPSGQNISLNGLAGKSISIAGGDLQMATGAVVDIRGGGDLLATRWIPGNGGSVDILGTATTAWGSGTNYTAGDLVLFNGETWSARVSHSGQTPTFSRYWTKVPVSYAVLPISSLPYAPFNTFNTGPNAGLLGGDPGYVSTGIQVGDTVTLDAGSGLPAGTYTLLPSRYALMPGAFLVTPVSNPGIGVTLASDGSRQVSGYFSNRFSQPEVGQATRVRFEVASSKVFGQRAQYQVNKANTFLGGLAEAAGSSNPQRLPEDAGNLLLHGGSGLTLAGTVLTSASGRGSSVDISSFADIVITGASGAPAVTGQVSIAADTLNSWNISSLLIGGVRTTNPDATVSVDVRTGSLEISNAGQPLKAADIVLVSDRSLMIGEGASLVSSGDPGFKANALYLDGDGSLIRVGNDVEANVFRSAVSNSGVADLIVGQDVTLDGKSVVLDSTNGMSLSSSVRFNSDRLVIGSGGITLLLDPSSNGPSVGGSSLVLGGTTLRSIFRSDDVSLRSYGSIDFYGSGQIGSSDLGNLTLSSSGIRGFETAGKGVTITARQLTLDNALVSAAGRDATASARILNLRGDVVRMGEGVVQVSGFDEVHVDASQQWRVAGEGRFSTVGTLTASTPLITGEAGAIHSIFSTGAMALNASGGESPGANSLGAGLSLQASSIAVNTTIDLPSGGLDLSATGGDVVVSGKLSVAGTSNLFNKQLRFTNAGEISLNSDSGDVIINDGGRVSVSGDSVGGNAGTLVVKAASGSFLNLGTVTGRATDDFTSGRFVLDVSSVTGNGAGSLAKLNSKLETGGFFESRDLRVRDGNIVIDHKIRSHEFSLTADNASISITGGIDASGVTGGSISLTAHGDLTLAPGAYLTVAADRFSSAGKGGAILLEAGNQKDGFANDLATLTLAQDSMIDLSVSEFVAGRYDEPGSSAFEGKFTGTLHLRAPRSAGNDELGIASIRSQINGASSVIAEGFKVYQPVGGVLNISLKNTIHADNTAYLGSAGAVSANESAIRTRLLGGAVSSGVLGSVLVLAPGVEIINPTGNLTLGLANPTGSSNAEALSTGDWDLSSFRYGSSGAAGILTLRASEDLVFNNTLSDGFTPITKGSPSTFFANGGSLMWLATLSTINDALPVNTQSWSYRLTAGADTNSSNFRSVLDEDQLQPLKGSVTVGEFYPAVPNSLSFGTSAGVGTDGQTADTIRISTNTTDRGNRFEVVRTGTGDISVSAGRDIQLRNPFSTIYTAGVALPISTTVFSENDFVVPIIPTSATRSPSQSAGGQDLGTIQQLYQPVWAMGGGNLTIVAANDIGRFTRSTSGEIVADTSRQMPTNWLYRRGFVDSATGTFSNEGGFGDSPDIQNSTNVYDPATSTTWWIDYSNFFQGFGTLGGGDIVMTAGRDTINADAVAPTNARMAGRMANPAFGSTPEEPEFINLAPDANNLVEYGGGDIRITTGRNIDGGIYYLERGDGTLTAGGSIVTNASRSPSRGILANEDPFDPLTWLPTTLFVGKSNFDVVAKGDVLIGPVTNPFLLPQGLNNKFWYKTFFSTFSDDAGVSVSAYGGDVTHRNALTLAGSNRSEPILGVWFRNQNQLSAGQSSSSYQPWLRLTESDVGGFDSVFRLNAPNLASTSFAGDIHVVGDMTLAPSPTGGLELNAAGSVIGINPTGLGTVLNQRVTVWTSATINVSDAPVSSVPGFLTPLASQAQVGRTQIAATLTNPNLLVPVTQALNETGSYSGAAGTAVVKQLLHGSSLLHANDPNPVRINALGGDVSGFTLFSPKATRIVAQNDISDVAFYIQNLDKQDISLVSAGNNIVLYSETSQLRLMADNPDSGNIIGDTLQTTSVGGGSNAQAGDLQISGPGVLEVLEVLAGRNIDLGTGANFADGTGSGITSIGNSRNLNLPFPGADLVVLAGTKDPTVTGPALGLAESNLDVAAFIAKYLTDPAKISSDYLRKIGKVGRFASLGDESQAIVALEQFYQLLRDSGRSASKDADYSAGFETIKTLFGKAKPPGEVDVRAREIRTVTGGSINLAAAGGGITLASEVFGNPLTPPGIVTEFGGSIGTFTRGNVDIGQARIFTLRGGDITMWSSHGNIAAGTSPRTVVTAPPTRVVVDPTSATVQTDLGGLATGGGIGVLAAVKGVEPGNVDLIAPNGFVDAGDAGIRVTGNLNIAAQVVLNSSNISTGGTTSGSSVSVSSSPSVSTVTSASTTAGATTAVKPPENAATQPPPKVEDEPSSIIEVEVLGYSDSTVGDEDEDENKN
jgi:filamentous hemagglutinin